MKLAHRRRGLVQTDRAQQEGGYVLVKFALLLVPLLLMTGLSVDVGSWYSRIADIQKAADAAALAGVVWLPDETAAARYAREEATRNGFTDGVDNISVDIERAGDRRLRVTISDGTVESFFWSNLGGGDIDLTRSALAEYVLPVPLGSPRNYFGTGRLLDGDAREYLYQAVNPACTSKVQGDRHQALHFKPFTKDRYGDETTHLANCAAPYTNKDYRQRGYELYIEAQEGRPSDIEVLLYDPQYTNAGVQYQVQGPDRCTTYTAWDPSATGWIESTSGSNVTITGPAEYQTRTRTSGSGSSWGSTVNTLNWPNTVTRARNLIRYRTVELVWTPATGWTESTSGSNVTITGPAQYQTRTRTSGSGSSYGTTQNLETGQTVTRARNLIRYKTGANRTYETCVETWDTRTEAAIDNQLATGDAYSEDEDYTFTLYAADDTPLDDSDNVPVPGCSKVYTPGTSFDNRVYLGSRRWNLLCTITTGMKDGRYILRVQNEGQGFTKVVEGSNSWGAVAKYTSAPGDGLCDGRNDPMCPRVYGRDAISVYANSDNATASFFLAEIEPEHTGKTLELELWDPGEGGQSIRFLKPTGTNTWEPVDVTWISYNDDESVANRSTGAAESISLRSGSTDLFNGRLLRIQIPLEDYAPPSDNRWWKIEYTFGSKVTDRTTWSARVIGDPVHLLEEEAD
ncbi:MAG TPA: pilus assembly protein TadG-related protein [Iamia sp.]|nr:pilus assembly protein TadG-related protein [Iamia sp.]